MKKFTKVSIVVVVLIILIGGGIFVWQYFGKQGEEPNTSEVAKDKTAGWQTYRSEEYGYEVRYPSGWEIIDAGLARGSVGFRNKKESTLLIYPDGFPTSLIDAINTVESKDIIGEKRVSMRNYLTEEGDWWARLIEFQEHPSTWSVDHWIWIRLDIIDERVECAVMPPPDGECGYGVGRKFFGTIDRLEQQTIDQILSTFRFIE